MLQNGEQELALNTQFEQRDLMERTLLYLENLPDVIWAGVFAAILTAVITLIGVMISNGSNTKRLLKQLAHDERQRDKDREMKLRRDIFIEAIERISSVTERRHQALRKLDFEKRDSLQEAQDEGLGIPLQKVLLVGNNDTVRAITDLAEDIERNHVKSMLARKPIYQLQLDIQIVEAGIKAREDAVKSLLEEVKASKGSPSLSGDAQETLKKSLTELNQSIEKWLSKKEKMQKDLVKLEFDYISQEYQHSIEQENPFVEAIIAMRRESNMGMDEARYRKEMKERAVSFKDELQEVIRAATQGIEEFGEHKVPKTVEDLLGGKGSIQES